MLRLFGTIWALICLPSAVIYASPYMTTDNPLPSPLKLSKIVKQNANYTPYNVVQSNYKGPSTGKLLHQNNPSISNIEATVQWNTSRPAVNLENYKISSIQCSERNPDNENIIVNLIFNTSTDAMMAYQTWAIFKDNFIAFIGPERKCGGVEEFSVVNVQSVNKDENVGDNYTEFYMTATFMSMEEAINEVDIKIKQHEPPKLSNASSKRKMLNAINKEWPFPLDFNYNKQTNSVTNQTISVFNSISDGLVLECINCYSRGDAVLELHIIVAFKILVRYNIKLRGDWHSNLNTAIQLREYKGFSRQKVMPPKALPALTIPGVFELGSELQLNAGILLDVPTNMDMHAGFYTSMKFDIEIYAPWGLFEKPRFKVNVGELKINPHTLKISENETIKPELHLIPGITFAMKVFKFAKAKLIFQLDNSIGIHFNSTDNRCLSEGVGAQLSHEHQLTLDLQSKLLKRHYNLWKSGVKPIGDPLCIRPTPCVEISTP